MTTKKGSRLTLPDRLSRLSQREVLKLLGPNGAHWLRMGGTTPILPEEQIRLDATSFELQLDDVTVKITLADDARKRLRFRCSRCASGRGCEHVGAAFALILEEKVMLGLAREPDDTAPLETLDEESLVRRALEERHERAHKERMKVQSSDPHRVWTDYMVTSAESGKTYRVALRGTDRGDSFCSCPDFRKNTLGTCKHVLHVLHKVEKRYGRARLRRPYARRRISVHVDYGEEDSLRLRAPQRLDADVEHVIAPVTERTLKTDQDVRELMRCLRRLEILGQDVVIYPDAEERLESRLFRMRVAKLVEEVRGDPARHPLRRELLQVELLPYQLDGIAFAVGAGRAVLADDMGLGKTIQGIGVAELLAREAGIERVLVVCPTSLKSQWKDEIQRFSSRTCGLVLGSAAERARQYDEPVFFTVCNYEQVLRDMLAIERVRWDLIILDEGQRIKNWEAKTSRIIKCMRSRFALVLTGTPLENRLEELYSVVEFIDDRRLGPGFRFFHRHRMVDEKGKVLGYRNLEQLRGALAPVLLRRTRAQVMEELPPRTTDVVRVTPTDEQLELHGTHMQTVSTIVNKRFLTEVDLLRLQKALLMCRMSANSTFLVDKQPPGHSSKLEAVDGVIERLAGEEDRKVILFSEWTTMLSLIEPLLQARDLEYVRLDGSIPQRNRQTLVRRFQTDPACRFFLATNAGSTGLNLQAANTVLNVDLPWSPAVLEQRIARAHRMGQRRPVHVILFVTEDTIEESLLATLAAKHELALAALDAESVVDVVELHSGVADLKRRLEVLLGAKPEAPLDESELARTAEVTRRVAQKERVAEAGGQLLRAAFQFLGELVPDHPPNDASRAMATKLREQLHTCLEPDERGRQTLTITLPDSSALDGLAENLARLLMVEHAGPVRSKVAAREAAAT